MRTTVNALPNESTPDFLAGLLASARESDGQPPFSDQSLVELERGERSLLRAAHGAAIFSADEVELVIDPAHRGAGHGTALAETVLREHAGVKFAWAHGDHPASRALAARFSFTPIRMLLQLRAPVAEEAATADARIRNFQPGRDDRAWLHLNATAFADHPEQGKLIQRDLDDRMAAEWFDAEDFLLLADGENILGFCWLKVVGSLGEIYAIGIDPERQGEGLGRILMTAAFSHLARRGIPTVALYVEADNEPALALYRRYGFAQHTIDVRYERTIH